MWRKVRFTQIGATYALGKSEEMVRNRKLIERKHRASVESWTVAAKAIGEFGAAKAEGGKEQVEMEGSKDKEGPMIVGGRYESENKRIEGI